VSHAEILRDVVYAEVMGFRPLTLDLHLPQGGPSPVILFVHGGGWRTGSKSVFTPTISARDSFDRMTAAGFAVASVDYRLSGEARFPAQVHDVRASITWLREHADDHRLDGSHIVLWGESAGATIAALVALEPASGILGVIDWYGPSNLISLAQSRTPEIDATSRESEWLGFSALEQLEVARNASPVFAVHEDAPPFYIAHGTRDAAVSFSQSEEFVEALREKGVDVRFERVDGANHMWRDFGDPASLVAPALSFAREVVRVL
jgi:acetyl esterase/lipase